MRMVYFHTEFHSKEGIVLNVLQHRSSGEYPTKMLVLSLVLVCSMYKFYARPTLSIGKVQCL